MIVLTFSDAEEALVNQILNNLKAEDFQIQELPVASPLTVAGLTLYPNELRVEHDGQSRSLGPQQFDILFLLTHNPRKILRKP